MIKKFLETMKTEWVQKTELYEDAEQVDKKRIMRNKKMK